MEHAEREESARQVWSRSGVLLEHEVGEGSDRWAPPVSDSRAPQDLLISGNKRGEGAGVWADWAVASGPRGRKEQAEEGGGRKGEGRIWDFGSKLEGESSSLLFILLFESLIQNQFGNHFELS